MIKVFEDFDFSRVGQMQSLLESHGIRTFLKNEFGSSVVGELPFVEVIPQLFVIEKKDLEKAKELISTEAPAAQPGADWICSECGVEVDGHFARCWNCGKALED
jgi:hypothetical protein